MDSCVYSLFSLGLRMSLPLILMVHEGRLTVAIYCQIGYLEKKNIIIIIINI